MSPEVAILQRIQEALPDVADQFYMLKGPQQPVLPVGVIQLVDDPKDVHLRGGQIFGRARIQIDIYAGESSGSEPYQQAENLAFQVHGDEAGSCLAGFRGHVGGSPGGLFIECIRRLDRQSFYEPDEKRLARMRMDYFVYYRGI